MKYYYIDHPFQNIVSSRFTKIYLKSYNFFITCSARLCIPVLFLTGFVLDAAAQAPTIHSFAPESGPVGTTVIINGANFSPVAANNIVYFGAVKAMVTAASVSLLTVTLPTSGTYQPITVTTNNLTAYSNKPFNVTYSNNGTGEFLSNSFTTVPELPTGTQLPTMVAMGDLDLDGKPDLVSTNSDYGTGTVTVFRNTGSSGTIAFAEKTVHLTGNFPWSIAISDVDGDGKLDLAVTITGSGTGIVSVLKNISTIGNIAFATRIDYQAGADPRSIAVGDLDSDGKPDMAVTNLGSSTVSVFRNISTGGTITFEPKTDYATASGPSSIAIGDLNQDGKPDLAVASNPNTVSVFRNTSIGGTISFAGRTNFANQGNPFGIAIGDLDGDNKPDIAVAGGTVVSVHRNTSTGQPVSFAGRILFPSTGNARSVAIHDLNGDGKPDMASTNDFPDAVSVFKNTGNIGVIAFASKVDYPIIGTEPRVVALGDLDGDNRPDMVTANYNFGTVSVLRNQITCISPTTFLNNGQIVLDASCGMSDGNISIIPTSGKVPFMYSINAGTTYTTGPDNGLTFNNLAPGIYQLRLSDADGCESEIVGKTINAVYGSVPTFLNNLLVVKNASCGFSDGNISIIPTSGTPPFRYSINAGTTYVSGPNGGYTFTSLAAGVYNLRLKDAGGCESGIISRIIESNCPLIAVALKAAATNTITIAPNPTSGRFRLEAKSFTTPKIDVSIYNGTGTMLQKAQVNLGKNNGAYFDLSGSLPGLYFIKVVSADGIKTSGLVLH